MLRHAPPGQSKCGRSNVGTNVPYCGRTRRKRSASHGIGSCQLDKKVRRHPHGRNAGKPNTGRCHLGPGTLLGTRGGSTCLLMCTHGHTLWGTLGRAWEKVQGGRDCIEVDFVTYGSTNTIHNGSDTESYACEGHHGIYFLNLLD